MDHSAAAHTPSSFRVLTTPELASLVSGHLHPPGIARLSRTSRQIFNILAPLLWQNVDGAHHLLGLIKSTYLRYPDEPGNPRLQEVHLGHHPHSNPFERFNFYAPFVESMNVYPKNWEFYYVSGWQALLPLDRNQPLLPNLKRLRIATTDSQIELQDITVWIRLFAGPSLVDLSWCIEHYFWPDDIWALSHTTTSEIMNQVVALSPNIQRIVLAPRQIHDPLGCDPKATKKDLPLKLWYEYFEELPFIRHLSITNGWLFHSSFIALSKLQTLESVEFFVDDFEGFVTRNYIDEDLPDHAFPSLRRLAIRRLTVFRPGQIFEARKLFARIEELEISLGYSDFEHGLGNERGRLVGSFVFPSLARIPRLKSLRMDGLNEEEPPTQVKRLESLSVPAQIPLQKIDISEVTLGKAPFTVDLGVTWPNVTELVLPSQSASLEELAYFAAMPVLSRLVVKLKLITTVTPPNIPTTNHAPLTVLESAKGGKLGCAGDVIKHNARVLNLLWPSLRRVSWVGSSDRHSTPDSALNQALQVFASRSVAADTHEGGEVQLDPSLEALLGRLRNNWPEITRFKCAYSRFVYDIDSDEEAEKNGYY